jgi:hypothetical protein
VKKTVIRQGADDRGWVNIKGILYVWDRGRNARPSCHETLHHLTRTARTIHAGADLS